MANVERYDPEEARARNEKYKKTLEDAESSIKAGDLSVALDTFNRLLFDTDETGDLSALECALSISVFALRKEDTMPYLINYLQCIRRYRPLNDEEISALEKQLGLIGGALAMANSVLREDESYYAYAKFNLLRDRDPQELADFESQAIFNLAKRFFKEP